MVRDLLGALGRQKKRLGHYPPNILQRVEGGYLLAPVLVKVLRDSLRWEREMVELYELALPGSGDEF